ncbi:hypothetical protein ACFYQT_40795 [Streptomyces tibetensis]|uniref:Uncharacterized protein n=1 Tax=Streptomyces tibetensis TaxID=2382123 RepID=A0ABW6N8X7_9ACTN
MLTSAAALSKAAFPRVAGYVSSNFGYSAVLAVLLTFAGAQTALAWRSGTGTETDARRGCAR